MSCSCTSFGSYIGNINCPTIPIPNLGIPCPPVTTTGTVDSGNVYYNGASLPCTGIVSGDTLAIALGKIDNIVCTTIGDFSTFNTFCLAPIATLQEFVETISEYVCNTQTQVDTFINTTFVDYQTVVDEQFNTVAVPGVVISCAGLNILIGDDLSTVITKLGNAICAINTGTSTIDLSGVNWAQCFTVGVTPTTIAAGFNVVISQICQLNTLIQTGGGGGGTLPTFNTIGSCLPSQSASNTLVATVNELIIRTCQAPTFDINALTWNCITKPSTTTTDLQAAFQTVLTSLDYIYQRLPVLYSGDFVVTNIDNTNPCLGRMISLSSSVVPDRFVAATSVDIFPGTLQDKLTAGTNITLDYITTPGQAIINAIGGTGDHKVASDSTDISPNYLIDKVEAGVPVYGVTVIPILDATTSRVQFSISIDPVALLTALLNTLTPGSEIATTFCQTISSCPSPCAAPSNVTVTYNSVGLTTTTTSTTTTTTTT